MTRYPRVSFAIAHFTLGLNICSRWQPDRTVSAAAENASITEKRSPTERIRMTTPESDATLYRNSGSQSDSASDLHLEMTDGDAVRIVQIIRTAFFIRIAHFVRISQTTIPAQPSFD